MTLRLRLVLGLLTLLAVGLVVFGLATSTLYSRSEYDNLDAQMRAAMPSIAQQLEHTAGQLAGAPANGSPIGPGPIPGRAPSVVTAAPSGTYAFLVSDRGKVLAHWDPDGDAAGSAKLPEALRGSRAGRFVTVGASKGRARYRVLLAAPLSPTGDTVVMVTPISDVASSVSRLVLIEAVGGAALLLALSAGAWGVVRRELHPLERMAGSARSITAGDLSQRVSTAGPPEVSQLGAALNTMLEDIEVAFKDRESTELRLRRFLADASHELRTPLTSIQGFAELFRVGGDQALVDLPTILRRIEEESARMAVLVDDLLLLARLDRPRPVERTAVDLTVLAADTCSDMVAQAPERTVTLDAPTPLVVHGDRHHLHQALANLAVNAIRHTPAGTPIEVSVRRQGGEAVVSVRDHGPGLSPEAKACAFEPFWQADAARAGPGTGLGLSIVAAVADEHGGRADVGDAPGGGALFSLHLPIPLA